MTSSTLHSLHLSPAQPANVGEALRELAVAGQRLVMALWAAAGLRASTVLQRPAMTAYEEAEELRTFALSYIDSDPHFANDLFAAADRHEISARR